MNSFLATGATARQDALPGDKKLLGVIEQNNAVLADLSASLSRSEKPSTEQKVRFALPTNNSQPSVAALANSHGGNSEIEELKELLLEMIESQNRHFDARIRGLVRRNPGQRDEIPRQRTRDGQPLCFTCGRRGHFQASCPDRRNNAPRAQLPQQNRSHGSNYSYINHYNLPRDNNRNFQQQGRRDQPLAALDEDLCHEDFVAPIRQYGEEHPCYPRSQPANRPQYLKSTTQHRVRSSYRRLEPKRCEPNVVSTIKPTRSPKPTHFPVNTCKQSADKQSSNQKPTEIGSSPAGVIEQSPEPKVTQATSEPVTDQVCDTSNIPVEFKPALDLLLHAIKQSQSASTTADISSLQNVNTLVVTNIKDTSDQTAPKQSRPTLSEETLNVQESIPTEVKTEWNSSSTDQLTTITTPSTPKNVPQHLPYTGAKS